MRASVSIKQLAVLFSVFPRIRCLNISASRKSPVYLEMNGPPGLVKSLVENQFLNQVANGEVSYRLIDEEPVSKDSLFKSKMLNMLTRDLHSRGAFCATNKACIQNWLLQCPSTVYERVKYLIEESKAVGCMTIGGCTKSITDAVDYHIVRGDSVVFESDLKLYDTMKARVMKVQQTHGYRMKVLGLVATSYDIMVHDMIRAEVEGIYAFLANPKGQPAPILRSPVDYQNEVRASLCNMDSVLRCLSGSQTRALSTGYQSSCSPMVDGMYVWTHDRDQAPRLLAFAVGGVQESNENFEKAHALVRLSMPPGTSCYASFR